MLPLYLLNSIKGEPIMVELKRGDTMNGVLTNCDSWMNITLKDVVVSDAHGENFYKVKDIYIKGIHIKYITMSNELIDKFREEQNREKEHYHHHLNNNYNNNNNGGFQRRGGGYR
ncbi:DEKNAAC100179, partial [Brettanomyces naardenensis]